MNFEVVFLGTGAAVPTSTRGTTSQFVDIHGHTYLVDAGEGVQLALRRERLKFQKLRGIFISHMHGDHVLGLPGLLSTMSLLGRQTPLTVWGPPELGPWLAATWSSIQAHFAFDLHVEAWQEGRPQVLLEAAKYRLVAFPAKHRLPTCGLRIEEHSLPWTLNSGHPAFLDLSHRQRRELKAGLAVQIGDQTLTPEACCSAPPRPRSYVYSGDTRPCQALLNHAKDATLLYHDATFATADAERAKRTHHSTAYEAARLAHQAGVDTLVLGHISSRYKEVSLLLNEAKTVHGNTLVAHDGMRQSLVSI